LLVASLGLLLTSFLGNVTSAYASEKSESVLQRTVTNTMVQKGNEALEDKAQLTQDDLDEISEFSKIKYDKIDGDKVAITIQNNIPERTAYYKDGTVLQEYATSIVSGEYDESYKTLDVELYLKMTYSVYMYNGFRFSRLNYGYGKLVNCWEQGYRNLKIRNTVFGDYQNPDGSHNISSETYNSKTISSPTKGVLYSLKSPSSNYYGTGAGTGTINVKVSIEWKHGSWYTTSWSIAQ
jgi:hypothetical protein